jgi:hypothetical protein
MSTTDGTKSAGKSGRRKGKAAKAKAEQPKKAVSPESSPGSPPTPDQKLQPQPQPDRAESPKLDPQPAVERPVAAIAASPDPQPAASLPPVEPPPAEPVLAQPSPSGPASAEPVSAELSPAEPAPAEAAPAELPPVSLQAIANAYRDYTRKSIEEFGSFVEQLSGVRSLDKAMTVQSEFVKRAYETSVAESQKICELHNRLAKQTLDPFKGLTGKAPATHGKP